MSWKKFFICIVFLLLSFMPFSYPWFSYILRGLILSMVFHVMIIEAIDPVQLFILGGLQDLLNYTPIGLHILPLLILERYVMLQCIPVEGYGFKRMVVHFFIASFIVYTVMWCIGYILFQGKILLWPQCMQWIVAVIVYISSYPLFERILFYGG